MTATSAATTPAERAIERANLRDLALAAQLTDEMKDAEKEHARKSARRRKVFDRLLARGVQKQRIADACGISHGAVRATMGIGKS